ncbi:MAG TPA: STAS domain-containing protein [Candidatus Eremiobacteraceae bacterium]|nr:STAS domain-containing protein [Candidatus Eremiobacteraceae bacterium]
MRFTPAGPGWTTLKIERQLDLVSAPMVRAALLATSAGEKSNLLIDLDAVDAADELGIATLIAAVKRVRDDHPTVRVAILAQRSLLADSVARKLPSDVAAVYRDRNDVRAAMTALSAA